MNDEKIKKIVDEQQIVSLALVTPNNTPHNTPVWISSSNNKLYIFTHSSRAKTKYAELNPNCMIAFTWASIRGKIKCLYRGSQEFNQIKDVMDKRYERESGYLEFKQNWDVAFEITPTKLLSYK